MEFNWEAFKKPRPQLRSPFVSTADATGETELKQTTFTDGSYSRYCSANQNTAASPGMAFNWEAFKKPPASTRSAAAFIRNATEDQQLQHTRMDDDWENLFVPPKEKKKKLAPPVPSSSSAVSTATSAIKNSACKKTDQSVGNEIGSLRGEEDSIPLNDSALERKRREDRIKQQDAKLFGDLLEGCDTSGDADIADNLAPPAPKPQAAHILSVAAGRGKRKNKFELKTFADCKNFAKAIGPIIAASDAKSPAWLDLMTGMLKHVIPKMTEEHIQTLQKRFTKMAADQAVSRKLALQPKNAGVATRPLKIRLKCCRDCDYFVRSIGPSIAASHATSPAWLALMTGLSLLVLPRMTDMNKIALEKKFAKLAAAQSVSRKLDLQSKVKFYLKNRDQIVNYKEEYDMIYGKREYTDDDIWPCSHLEDIS